MQDILKLVRSGRLGDATAAIQSRLGGKVDGVGDSPDRPMKDVTPAAKAIDAPVDARVDAPRARRKPEPARNAVAAWRKHDGALPYYLFTPANPVADAPLIVMLHGCTQTAEDFARGTAMNAAADKIGAHVIWPEQQRNANANVCWNWFEAGHQGRGGEAAAIADIASRVRAKVAPQASGIHVAGLSAGGAMAAILGAHYGDVFASVSIHAGLPAGSASDMASAFSAMRKGGPARASIKVPCLIFHGTADKTVALANGKTLARDVMGAGKPRQRTSTINGRRVTITSTDTPVSAAFWQIEGLGHAWSGGDAAGSFADPKGPSATDETIRFMQSVTTRKPD